MYPLKFKSIYHKKIWGGNKLKNLREDLKDSMVGESWDLCFSKDAVSIVENGEFKGKSLKDIIYEKGNEVLGYKFQSKTFPLIIKIIDAGEDLSLQVHPSTKYSQLHENESGKNELWYIMECEPDAQVILGVKSSHIDRFQKLIFKDTAPLVEIMECLNQVSVNPGDFFYIPEGMIHAVGKGILLAEFQDNSDITYRLCDYGRGRRLDLEKGLATSNFSLTGEYLNKRDFIITERFCARLLLVDGILNGFGAKESFHTITCVYGQGTIEYGFYLQQIKAGDSYLIPASIERYLLRGTMKVIRLDLS